MGLADGADFGSVAVKYSLVVGLVVFSKDLVEVGVGLVAVLLASFFGHLDAAEGHEGALERLIGLQPHDLFQVLETLVDVARLVARDGGDDVGVHVQHAAVPAFFGLQALQFVPQFLGSVRRARQEGLVSVVGGVVALNKIADVNFALPESTFKAIPCVNHYSSLLARIAVVVRAETSVLLFFCKTEYSNCGGAFEGVFGVLFCFCLRLFLTKNVRVFVIV